MINTTFLNRLFGSLILTSLLATSFSNAQSYKSQISLNDLSAFKSSAKSWTIAGDAQAGLSQDNELMITKGNGILANYLGKGKPGSNLVTIMEHGDIDLEMDFLLSKATNSGVFLQGRYEVQLFDSWGNLNPNASDNGGIYERWDDTKPEGEKGYDGHAPRQNVSRAPGLWQHLKVSFQAPRFDAQGKKTSDAKILRLWLNGVLVQENIVLSGPTRYAIDQKESVKGPLIFQGEYGSAAFKNIRYTSIDSKNRDGVSKTDNLNSNDAVSPIFIGATDNKILRSFTDLPGNLRVNHAVGVGSREQLHYTYDLDNGMIVQIWRGNFLDATPMWHERGDGSSKPAGSVQYLGKPAPGISRLISDNDSLKRDTLGTGYKPKGYTLDKEGRPTFKYLIYGTAVSDASKVLPEGKGLRREISLSAPISNAVICIAKGRNIILMKSGMYIIDGSYYINLEEVGGTKPRIRTSGSIQELIIPVKQKLIYSIIL